MIACWQSVGDKTVFLGHSNRQTVQEQSDQTIQAYFAPPDTSQNTLYRGKEVFVHDLETFVQPFRSKSQTNPAHDTANSMDKQQFLILGKSARGRALCELINRATAEPGIFTFGELLSLPNVQEVRAEVSCAGLQGLLHLLGPGACSDRSDQNVAPASEHLRPLATA